MCDGTESGQAERRLVEGLRRGETGAFDAIFEKYRAPLFAYVRGLIGERETAVDVVQDAFVSLVARPQRIDPAKGVGPWLFRTARNRAIDLLRRRRFERPADAGSGTVEQPAAARVELADPAREAAARDRHAGLRDALAALPAKERDILMLRFHAGLTFRQIADTLGRPLGTVLWQAREALATLRVALGDEYRPE
ncbi:MAG: sigma-70 family RNA polymerase sigma factor [Kiritimatiellae bacterium]|nr:sigma-70 family RNA polymerase sigma factor [Kiritimatiellia bacterium]